MIGDRFSVDSVLYFYLFLFYGRYPTHAEYVKVAQALIQKYPFLKDVTGNGYVSSFA